MSALLPIPFNNPYTYTGHSGVDFPQPKGTPFRASGPGVVSSIDYSVTAGHTVWVKYDNGPNVGYCHMDSRTTDVRLGDRVYEGTVLGRVGKLGKRSTGYHLHVEVAGHATTAGFWRFFTRDRVLGEGSPAGGETSRPVVVAPKIMKEDDPMLMLKIIAGKKTHLVALGEGVFKHFVEGEPYEKIMRVSRAEDDWQGIDISELGSFLATYGCDRSIWDFRDGHGKSVGLDHPDARFMVLDPLTGNVASGNTWTSTGAIRAALKVKA